MYTNISQHKDNPVLNFNNEEFEHIEHLDNLYAVSKSGKVYSTRTNKILSPFRNRSGYNLIITSIDCKVKKFQVHRLVAEAFVSNPNDKPQVNHIDGDKDNNNVSNLEWVTGSENIRHAIVTGLSKHATNKIGFKYKKPRSIYHNVTYRDGPSKPWSASIKYNGKRVHCKWFATEVDAALHVNWIYDKLEITNRPRNIIK